MFHKLSALEGNTLNLSAPIALGNFEFLSGVSRDYSEMKALTDIEII